MGKKIKDYDAIDFLESRYKTNVLGDWLGALTMFFCLGMSIYVRNVEKAMWSCLLVAAIMFIGLMIGIPYQKRLKEEIERLKKEKKEKDEGIEEKDLKNLVVLSKTCKFNQVNPSDSEFIV